MENNLDKILSDKFQNHKPDVPSHLWGNIEQGLHKKKKDRNGWVLLVLGIFTSSLVYAFLENGSNHTSDQLAHTPIDSSMHTLQPLHKNNTAHYSKAQEPLGPNSTTPLQNPPQGQQLSNQTSLQIHDPQTEIPSIHQQQNNRYKNAQIPHDGTSTTPRSDVSTTQSKGLSNPNHGTNHTSYTTPTASLYEPGMDLANAGSTSITENKQQGTPVVNQEARYSSTTTEFSSASMHAPNPRLHAQQKMESKATSALSTTGFEVSTQRNSATPLVATSVQEAGIQQANATPAASHHEGGTDEPQLQASNQQYAAASLAHADTVQATTTCLVVIPKDSSKKQINARHEAPSYLNDMQLRLTPMKAWGKHTDIDQSIQVEAVYGRRINSFLSAKVGLIYTSIGNPLHYNIPDRPNLGIPETKGAGFTDEAMGDVDSTMTLRSVTTLGISLGMEYEKVLYKKWSLQTGLSFVPSLLFKTSHHYEGGYNGKLYTNSMGAAGFRNLGLATLTHASIAYKPIKRAQITAGVQSSYYLISLHKNERLAPLTLGATLGLKWMF